MTFRLVIIVCAMALAPPQRPVALVHDLSGDVELISSDGKPRKCKPKQLIYLYDGDQLRVGPKARVTVGFLNDYHWEQLKPGKIDVKPNGCQPANLVDRVEPPKTYQSKIAQRGVDALCTGRGAGLVLRGAPNQEQAPQVTPVFGEALMTDRPTLAWSSVADAKGYQVNLILSGSGRNLWTARADKPKLAFPADQPALKRNRTYDWEIYAENADGSVKQIVRSRFMVTSESTAAELNFLKPLAESDQPVDLAVAIAVYQLYNADGPALASCEKLADLAPSADVFRLLADLYARAGRAEDSKFAAAQVDGPNPSKDVITSKTLARDHKIRSFKGRTFSGEFAGYDFSGVTFDSCEFVDCTFTRGSTFIGAEFKNSQFRNANFSAADTSRVTVFGKKGDSQWKKSQEPKFEE